MEKPMVSVVTLTYKKFEYIYDAIDSVLSQKYPCIEYIISDDGSCNFPQKEIEEYISRHKRKNILKFCVMSSEKNNGTVKNINRAYRFASGDILIPLSADDIFYSDNVVDKIVSIMVQLSRQKSKTFIMN